jgi:hypothetical protein
MTPDELKDLEDKLQARAAKLNRREAALAGTNPIALPGTNTT